MQQTRAQIQLQYHQTLNRICEMELLAEKLTRLANSYRKAERRNQQTLREEESVYREGLQEESPGDALQAEAEELRTAAEDWYRRAREEYHTSLREIRMEEERRQTW